MAKKLSKPLFKRSGTGEYVFKPRRFNGYVLKFGMLVVLIGALTTLIILLTQFTGHDNSTNEDVITIVATNPSYFIACTVCNFVGVVCLIAYYFLVGRQYRPHQHQLSAGRMHHVLIAIGLALLSIIVSFIMMAWTYKSGAQNRNVIAIVLVVLVIFINLAAVGYEQWAVFRIEQDILRARAGLEGRDGVKKDDGKKDESGPEQDDERASAEPKNQP